MFQARPFRAVFVAVTLCSAPICRAQPADERPDSAGSAREAPVLRSAVRPSRLRRELPEASGLDDQKEEWLKDNCVLGRPIAAEGVTLGPTELVVREGYALEHSPFDKIPLWVCEHATKAEVTGPLKGRKESWFKPDPELTHGRRAELADYKGSGYDRGHLSPNDNQGEDLELRKQTFFLSNMAPQEGKGFNQGIWAVLERRIQKWAAEREAVWIITGTMFYDPLEETAATADGVVPYYTIGANEVAVPTHWYKIVVAQRDGKWESIAFVFDNKKHGTPYRFENYVTTVDWIEERTGLNFMPEAEAELGGDAETELESVRSTLWD